MSRYGKILLNRTNWSNHLRKLIHFLYVSLERMMNTIQICSFITFISTYSVCFIETKLMSVEWLQFVSKSNRSSTQPPKHNGDIFLGECRVSTALCAICLVIVCACLCAEFLSSLCDVINTARCVDKLQKKTYFSTDCGSWVEAFTLVCHYSMTEYVVNG